MPSRAKPTAAAKAAAAKQHLQALYAQFQPAAIAGVDEVGRGPLAGEVLAAAVILPSQHGIIGLTDSKKLTEKKREALYTQICAEALAYSVGEASVAEIDQLNILHATMLAMQRAVAGLAVTPELVLIDGNRTPQLPMTAEAIVGGDALVESISAASIVAKVLRDRRMIALAERYPEYGFERHKGYGTALHLEALERYGPLPEHRRSFAPVARLVSE